jgi:hypothetical protein
VYLRPSQPDINHEPYILCPRSSDSTAPNPVCNSGRPRLGVSMSPGSRHVPSCVASPATGLASGVFSMKHIHCWQYHFPTNDLRREWLSVLSENGNTTVTPEIKKLDEHLEAQLNMPFANHDHLLAFLALMDLFGPFPKTISSPQSFIITGSGTAWRAPSFTALSSPR